MNVIELAAKMGITLGDPDEFVHPFFEYRFSVMSFEDVNAAIDEEHPVSLGALQWRVLSVIMFMHDPECPTAFGYITHPTVFGAMIGVDDSKDVLIRCVRDVDPFEVFTAAKMQGLKFESKVTHE